MTRFNKISIPAKTQMAVDKKLIALSVSIRFTLSEKLIDFVVAQINHAGMFTAASYLLVSLAIMAQLTSR